MTRRVRIVSEGDGQNSAVLVNGRPLDNVYRVDLTLVADDVTRATVHLIQVKADVDLPIEHVTFTRESTPIYDALSAEWQTQGWATAVWATAVAAGRCPICATGLAHVASQCPDDRAKRASQCLTP